MCVYDEPHGPASRLNWLSGVSGNVEFPPADAGNADPAINPSMAMVAATRRFIRFVLLPTDNGNWRDLYTARKFAIVNS
jgi:hypothetical protein